MTSPVDSDKTRIKMIDAKSDKTQMANPEVMEERLRKARANKAKAELSLNDKTRIVSKREEVLSKKYDTASSPNVEKNEDNSDKTQFFPNIKGAAINKNDIKAKPNKGPHSQSNNDATHYQPRSDNIQKKIEVVSDTEGSLGILKDRFILDSVLGAGGMGVVYKAKDRLKIEAQDRDPFVAVKVLGEEFKAHPEAFIALQRESRKSQRIAHPNIVNVHDFDRDENTVFMTMEFLDGSPLDKLIAQYRSIGLPRDDVWQMLQGMCAALTHAHTEKIIHSDFKPGNIFFTNKGITKVFDFGIARAVSRIEHIEDSAEDKTVFDAGSLGAVTPAYASFEMLEGDVPDVRDDIYALGCIAYELFTGEHPYDRANARDAVEKKLKPKKIPGLTNRQWRAIERACALKREDRIPSVDEFWREMTLKKSRTGLIITLILLLISGIIFSYTQFFMEQKPEFREDEVRDEIEYKLRVELQTKALESLIDTMAFTVSWEYEVWREFQSATKLLGSENVWLKNIKVKLYKAYILHIERKINDGYLEQAKLLIKNALRYSGDKKILDGFEVDIKKLLLEKEKIKNKKNNERLEAEILKNKTQNKAKIIAERNSAYNTAIDTVRKQLSCRSNVNMKDLGTAIRKLRELNLIKYNKEEPVFINQLSLCLEKIGRSYPERAKDSKKAAIRLFPGSSIIANIKIIPRDPCGKSIAGLGAKGTRAICRDRIPRIGHGPSLVVIPASEKGNMYAIGKYETSIDEINVYCESTGNCKKITDSNIALPATNLTMDIILGYLRWLSIETKREYRLPSYAEWLYASKARRGILDSNRNCTLKSRGIEKGGSLLKASVGKQNSWGLVNHIGNAQELVTQKGGSYIVVGGSNKTLMESCNFDFNKPYNSSENKLTTIRVLREINY